MCYTSNMSAIKLKRCNICKETKPITEFYIKKKNKDGYDYYCKDCRALYAKKYYNEHKEHMAEITRNYRDKARQELYEAYGGKCECCGETRIEFFTIDHINGNGAQERKAGRMLDGVYKEN